MQIDPARHYIGGTWREGAGDLGTSTNPADFSAVGQFHPGSAALTDEACAVARDTFFTTDWAHNPRLRSKAMFEMADRLEAAKDEIVALCVAENGKLRAEAMGETMGAISETRYYAGLARGIRGTITAATPTASR